MQLYRYFVSQSSEFCRIILCVAFQRVFIVVVYFVIDSVPKLLDTPSYMSEYQYVRCFIDVLGRMIMHLSVICTLISWFI
jgi:hypothetical protein